MTEVFKAPFLNHSKPSTQPIPSLEVEQVGIGMRIEPREGRFFVSFLLNGSPAEKAGIKVGDEILDIDGKTIASLSYEEVTSKLRGAKGSLLSLTLKKPQESNTWLISVIRDKQQTQSLHKKKSIQDLLFSSTSKPSSNLSLQSKPPSEKGSFHQIKKKTQRILNILQEKENVEPVSVPQEINSVSGSLESRLSGLQEDSLKQAEEAEKIPEEKEGFFKRETKRLQKASQRLKKATLRFTQKTGKIMQTLFEHFEEKHQEEQEFEYYSITEEMPQNFDSQGTTDDPNLVVLEESPNKLIPNNSIPTLPAEAPKPLRVEAPKPLRVEVPKPPEAPVLMKIMYDENAGKSTKSKLPPVPTPKKKKTVEIKPEKKSLQKTTISISLPTIDKKSAIKIGVLILLVFLFYFSLPKTPKQRPFTRRPIKVVSQTQVPVEKQESSSESEKK